MPWQLTAEDAIAQIREGRLTSEELVASCNERIRESDPQIGAWAYHDADQALEQARACDAMRRAGKPLGSLHGIPVGIKDIVDTADMPTECGSPLMQGRRPDEDATLISRLREAGAVIMGKTVSTQLAFMPPSATSNPHDPSRTPGGSSSGSAAAVAAGHVPLAVGSQTNGSVVRPASFCGIVGFKPTRGMISRYGVLQTSSSLDQMGTFGRSMEDVARLTDALTGYDRGDPGTYARPKPEMRAGCGAEVPADPALAWFELPYADLMDEDAVEGFAELVDVFGERVERLPSPDFFPRLIEVQHLIHRWEFFHHLEPVIAGRREPHVHPMILEVLDRVAQDSHADYEAALSDMRAAQDYFVSFFNDFDAVLSPPATGQAPLKTSGGTGDPIFCTIWTLCGHACLSLPWLDGADGLPVGVQLIGPSEGDDRLFRTAKWLRDRLEDELADEAE